MFSECHQGNKVVIYWDVVLKLLTARQEKKKTKSELK